MKDLYNTNKQFREYVDRYCQKYIEGRSIPVDEALQHAIVREAGEEYRRQE